MKYNHRLMTEGEEPNALAMWLREPMPDIDLETEDIGGTASRTAHFNVATGQTVISSNGQKREP